MKKSTRLLSVLLALVMLFTSMSVAVSARAPYLDGNMKTYDSIDNPYLTAEQAASIFLDMIDDLLAEEDMTFDLYILPVIDLTSINAAFDSIIDLRNTGLWKAGKYLLGDLKDIEFGAIRDNRRIESSYSSDLNMIYALVEFLYENKGILSSLVDGSIDLGLVSWFIDIGDYVDLATMLKEMVFEMAYEDVSTSYASQYTLDQLAQKIIDDLVDEMIADERKDIAEDIAEGGDPNQIHYIELLLGGGILDLDRNFYSIVTELADRGINGVLVPMLNGELKDMLLELFGLDGSGEGSSDLDAYASLINFDYTIPEFNFDRNKGVIAQLNDLLGLVVNNLLAPGFFEWKTGSDDSIMSNLLNLLKIVYPLFGDGQLDDSEVPTDPDELVAYTSTFLTPVLKWVIPTFLPDVMLPEDANTLKSIIYHVLVQYIAIYVVPEVDYDARVATGELDPNGDAYLVVLCDLLRHYIDGYTLVEIDQTVTDYELVLKSLYQWVLSYLDGLINANNVRPSDSIWEMLDKTIFQIIPIDWFPQHITNSKSLFVDNILENIITLDLNGLLGIFGQNKKGELSLPLKQILLNLIGRLVNNFFPGAFPYLTSLEAVCNNNTLGNFVNNLLGAVYTQANTIIPTLLKLAALLLGYSTKHELGSPSITVPASVVSSGSASATLKIRNTSTGVNTGYTDKNGKFHQDARYKYQILSITSDDPGITVSKPSSTIAPGATASCSVSGRYTKVGTVTFTIQYNILGHDGKAINKAPIYDYAFIYYTNVSSHEGSTVSTSEYHQVGIFRSQRYVFTKSVANLRNVSFIVNHEYENNTWQLIIGDHYNDEQTLTSVICSGTKPAGVVRNSSYDGKRIKACEDGSVQMSVKPYAISSSWDGTQPYGTYNTTIGITTSEGAYLTVPQTIVIYNTYNLDTIFSSALKAGRQPSNYTDEALWNEYMAALAEAYGILNHPKNVTTFSNAAFLESFKTAGERLNAAVAALDANATLLNGVNLKAQVNAYEKELDLDYEFENIRNGHFNHEEDYVLYTHARFMNAMETAEDYINDQKVVAGTERTNSLETVYGTHLMTINKDRMVRDVAIRTQLYNQITKANQKLYAAAQFTPDTWKVYEDALAFANEVMAEPLYDDNGDPALRQSKVNAAVRYLINAQNLLKKVVERASYVQLDALILFCETYIIPNQTTYTSTTWTTFYNAYLNGTLLNRDIPIENQANVDTVYVNLQAGIDQLEQASSSLPEFTFTYPRGSKLQVHTDGKFIYGMPEGASAMTRYLKVTPGALTVTPSSADGKYGTGTKIDVTHNTNLYTFYTLIIFGDVNGDSYVTLADAAAIDAYVNWAMPAGTEWAPDSAEYFAADINCDGVVDEMDSQAIFDVINWKAELDQTAGRGSLISYFD